MHTLQNIDGDEKRDLYNKASGASGKSEDIPCLVFLQMIWYNTLNVYNTFNKNASAGNKTQNSTTYRETW